MVSLLHEKHEDILCWDPYTMTLDDFTRRLSEYDLLIAARAHGVIIGAALGIPSIAIVIEPKLRLVCERLTGGTEMWCPPFDSDNLTNTVERMSEHWGGYSSAIAGAAAKCSEDALAGGKSLKNYIGSLL